MSTTEKLKMPYGKHKGKDIDTVPDDYLLHIYENHELFGKLKAYIEDNLDAIKKNAAKLQAEYQAKKSAEEAAG